MKDPGEECDDGDKVDDDGCTNTCTLPKCGDGILHMTLDEECDDGNAIDTDECTNACLPATCGDGVVWEGMEICDDGVNVGQEIGDCAPDCSRLVVSKKLFIGTGGPTLGNLVMLAQMKNQTVIEYLDSLCDNTVPGAKAMFGYQNTRVASVLPNKGDGQVDWVLQPWTQYVNGQDQVVWTTDEVALLGVNNGSSVNLMNAIEPTQAYTMRSGLDATWRNTPDNCLGWTSSSGSDDQLLGVSDSVSGYFDAFDVGGCDESARFYCAEQ